MKAVGVPIVFNPATNETCWDFPRQSTTTAAIEESSSSAGTEWTGMLNGSSGKRIIIINQLEKFYDKFLCSEFYAYRFPNK